VEPRKERKKERKKKEEEIVCESGLAGGTRIWSKLAEDLDDWFLKFFIIALLLRHIDINKDVFGTPTLQHGGW